ncbi:MAG: hypothetical protein Q7V01_00910, partial [Vicinamibacterales bacterium]|nr:hypothetical protein [Vicinamibacterales bacterium]
MLKALQLLVPFLLALAGSLALTPVVRRLALRIGAVDRPDPRKVHKQTMPLLGGVAVLGSIAATAGTLKLLWPDHVLSQVDHNL